jgi:hypothetical protein
MPCLCEGRGRSWRIIVEKEEGEAIRVVLGKSLSASNVLEAMTSLLGPQVFGFSSFQRIVSASRYMLRLLLRNIQSTDTL